jgi:hypothetical protein
MFKKGDKVKVIDRYDCDNCRGKILEVVSVSDSSDWYPVNCKVEEDNYEIFREECLESIQPPKYNVGDEVHLGNFNNIFVVIKVIEPNVKCYGHDEYEYVIVRDNDKVGTGEAEVRESALTKAKFTVEDTEIFKAATEPNYGKGLFDDFDGVGDSYNINKKAQQAIDRYSDILNTSVTFNNNFLNKEETKMEEPITKLEKTACKRAKEVAIEEAIITKQRIYANGMEALIALKNQMISTEELLVKIKTEYADKAKILNVTKEDEKQLF